MSKSNYKRLGDYIREVNVRNRDLAVTRLVGLSMSKEFRTSTSNIIGTDLSNYKIVKSRQFSCDFMSPIRVYKLPVVLSKENDEVIVSPAYCVFEVVDTNKLLPEYLMMWFRRSEFDRYVYFKCDSAIRGGYGWDELCDTTLPIPDIAEQQRIVAEYEALSRRIAINEQICTKLEETAAALYRKMFVDNIDKENLPEGWRMGQLSDIIEITSGKIPPCKSNKQIGIYKYPIYGAGGIMGYTNEYLYNEKLLILGRVGSFGSINRVYNHCWLSDNTLIIRSEHFEYSYNILKNTDFDELNRGGVQGLITQTDIKNKEIIIPHFDVLLTFENITKCIMKYRYLTKLDTEKIIELQTLLLSKLATN